MMTPEDMDRIEREIQAQGFTAEQAEEFAGLLGDTIEVDADGKWIVRSESGEVLARLKPLE